MHNFSENKKFVFGKGKYPEIIMLQETRRTMFQSHVPGYQIIQKFKCESEDEVKTTRIEQPGSGNVILVKQSEASPSKPYIRDRLANKI